MPSEFVADGPVSYAPTNADPTQFGITFIPSDQGAIEAAHIRIAGTIYPAQRNLPASQQRAGGTLGARAAAARCRLGIVEVEPRNSNLEPLLANET